MLGPTAPVSPVLRAGHGRDENLIGVMQSDIELGFPTPPQETTFTVHSQQTG